MGGRPKKGLLKTTKAPRVTQEDNGDDLDLEKEEVDIKDDDDLDDDNDKELDAARDEATPRPPSMTAARSLGPTKRRASPTRLALAGPRNSTPLATK